MEYEIVSQDSLSPSDDATCAQILNLIENGDVESTKQLLLANPHLKHVDYGGAGWMGSAVFEENMAMIAMLLEIGCDVNFPSGIGVPTGTPLTTAIGSDNIGVIELLLDNGATIRNWNVIGAASGNKKKSLEMLILLEKYGANLHAIETDSTGEPMNALWASIRWGKQDVHDYLTSIGVQSPFPNKSENEG